MRLPSLVAAATLLAILLPGTLAAHAFLEEADPAVGSTVAAAPEGVTLRFSEELKPASGTLRVEDASGKRVDLGDVRTEGAALSVPLSRLAPGLYRVYWRAVSADGHASEGGFTFTVAP